FTAVPVCQAGLRTVPLPVRQDAPTDPKHAFKITSLAVSNNRVWIATQEQPQAGRGGTPACKLYQFEPAKDALTDLSDKTGEHSAILAMLGKASKIWMALEFDGIWSLDPESQEIHHYS